jgi:hypothetical protein
VTAGLTRMRTSEGRAVLVLAAAVALLALAPASARGALRVGSTTDPVGDVPQWADGSYVSGDVKAVDVVYDDSAGEVDVRVAL